MSEQTSYSPSYESYVPPAPKIPTLWDRALDRARTEIAVAGGLTASNNTMTELTTNSWMATGEREGTLQKATSTSLARLCAQNISLLTQNGGSSVLRLAAMMEAVNSVPHLAILASMEAGLGKVRRETEELLHLAQAGSLQNVEARARIAEMQLREITSRAHRRLAMAEGDLLQETMREAFRSLGYTISAKGNAMRATRGTTCIWADITGHGGLNLDVSGFSGRSCQTEIKALENILACQGLVLNRTATKEHQSRRGGDLAQRMEGIFATEPLPAMARENLWGTPQIKGAPEKTRQAQKHVLGG